MNGRRLRAGIAAAALSTSAVVLASPAVAVTEAPVWNIPEGAGGTSAQQYANLNQLTRLIDQTPRGAEITIGMYSQNQWATPGQPGGSILQHLVAADRRGVAVRGVMGAKGREIGYLQRALGKDRRKRSWIVTCKGSCRRDGSAGVHHTKGLTFSSTGGRHWVVVHGMTGNLTGSAARDQWNNQITTADKQLYDGVTRFLLSLANDRWQGVQRHATSRDGRVSVYFFPQPRKPEDPWLATLRRADCTFGKRNRERGVIWVDMAFATGYRNEFFRELGKKRRQGCRVEMAIAGQLVSPAAKRTLRKAGVPTVDAHRGHTYPHTKTMGIYARFGKANVGEGVWLSGSGNLTRAGQRGNDDTISVVRQTSAYWAGKRQHDLIWASGRRLW